MASTTHLPRLADPGRASAVLVDVLLATTVFAATAAQLQHGGVLPTSRPGGGLDPLGVALAVCCAAPMLGWRRFPVAAFVAAGLAAAVTAGAGYPLDLAIGPAIALFLLACARDRARAWTPRLSAAVVATLGAYLLAVALAQPGVAALALLHNGLAVAVAWFAGDRARLRREQLAQLRERAARAEREVAQQRRLAVAEERARIARDLHDSAAHAISLIAVRAGTARMRFGQDPDRTLAALGDVEEMARRIAAEMDEIVGTLRDPRPGDDVEPPPGLASLDTLVAHHAGTGLPVTVERHGPPRPLPAAADQAAYRILQESLTNAARHGRGGARITLRYADDALHLTITNPVPGGAAPRSGGGHGLIGMHERATLLGGTLHAGRADDVFQVRATIPAGGRRP